MAKTNSTLEIGRDKLRDLLTGEPVTQGGVAITLAVGPDTIRGLLDEVGSGEGNAEPAAETDAAPATRPTKKRASRKKSG